MADGSVGAGGWGMCTWACDQLRSAQLDKLDFILVMWT